MSLQKDELFQVKFDLQEKWFTLNLFIVIYFPQYCKIMNLHFCPLLVLALIRVCVTVASEYQRLSSPSWKKNLFGGIIGDTSLFVSLQHDSEELLMLRILRCDWLRDWAELEQLMTNHMDI